MNNHTANAQSMDGFDVWFFGGTPGPGETDPACTLAEPTTRAIDEDDARIPAFAHRCGCGQHQPAQAAAPLAKPSRQPARTSGLALHF